MPGSSIRGHPSTCPPKTAWAIDPSLPSTTAAEGSVPKLAGPTPKIVPSMTLFAQARRLALKIKTIWPCTYEFHQPQSINPRHPRPFATGGRALQGASRLSAPLIELSRGRLIDASRLIFRDRFRPQHASTPRTGTGFDAVDPYTPHRNVEIVGALRPLEIENVRRRSRRGTRVGLAADRSRGSPRRGPR